MLKKKKKYGTVCCTNLAVQHKTWGSHIHHWSHHCRTAHELCWFPWWSLWGSWCHNSLCHLSHWEPAIQLAYLLCNWEVFQQCQSFQTWSAVVFQELQWIASCMNGWLDKALDVQGCWWCHGLGLMPAGLCSLHRLEGKEQIEVSGSKVMQTGLAVPAAKSWTWSSSMLGERLTNRMQRLKQLTTT